MVLLKAKKQMPKKFLIPLLSNLLNPFYRFDLIQKDIIEDNFKLKEIMEVNNDSKEINEGSTNA